MVLGVCRRVLGNAHDAEDAFQATFLVLARKGRSIRQRRQVGNWLHGVAYRTALHARQLRTQQRGREIPMPDGVEPVIEPAAINELLPLLDEAVNQLDEKYRSAVVLCELEGHSRKEAAGLLGIAEGTLSSRLAKARRMRHDLSRAGLRLPGQEQHSDETEMTRHGFPHFQQLHTSALSCYAGVRFGNHSEGLYACRPDTASLRTNPCSQELQNIARSCGRSSLWRSSCSTPCSRAPQRRFVRDLLRAMIPTPSL
jgi:RNA polymerase sigma factor (sigma-70 family)